MQGGRLSVAHALLKECALALERVLLEGGPLRLFISADVEHLEEDMGVLKELFMAGGEGLSSREVEEEMAGLSALMRVMQLDTGEGLRLGGGGGEGMKGGWALAGFRALMRVMQLDTGEGRMGGGAWKGGERWRGLGL